MTDATAELPRFDPHIVRFRRLYVSAALECELDAPAQALQDIRHVLERAPDFLPARRVEVAALLASDACINADERVTAALRDQPTDAELNRLMDQKRSRFASNYTSNRTKLVALARAKSVVVASHDD